MNEHKDFLEILGMLLLNGTVVYLLFAVGFLQERVKKLEAERDDAPIKSPAPSPR